METAEKLKKMEKDSLGLDIFDFAPPSHTETYSEGENKSVKIKYLTEEDYKPGDLDTLAPGTYKWVFRVSKEYLGENLFGYTWMGTDNAVVRGDLKGEAYRRVRDHEVYAHNILGLGEEGARSLTGTHMSEFMPIYERMKLRR